MRNSSICSQSSSFQKYTHFEISSASQRILFLRELLLLSCWEFEFGLIKLFRNDCFHTQHISICQNNDFNELFFWNIMFVSYALRLFQKNGFVVNTCTWSLQFTSLHLHSHKHWQQRRESIACVTYSLFCWAKEKSWEDFCLTTCWWAHAFLSLSWRGGDRHKIGAEGER